MNKKVALIGGSKRWGSGKVIDFLNHYLHEKIVDYSFYESQRSLNLPLEIYKEIENNRCVIFQPSVCFPGFLRDLLVLLVLRIKKVDLRFVLLVDVTFKNPLMRINWFRKWFFGSSQVFGCAYPSLPVSNFILLPPFFLKEQLTHNLLGPVGQRLSLIHIGYRTKIKGWDRYLKIAAENDQNFEFFYCGLDVETNRLEFNMITAAYEGRTTEEVEKCLSKISEFGSPVLIFLSRYDFSPLVVLECGYWGVPIAVEVGTKQEAILSRFLPSDCYFSYVKLQDLRTQHLVLEKTRKRFLNYTNNLSASACMAQLYKKMEKNSE